MSSNGRMLITDRPAVNEVLRNAVRAAHDQGAYEGISDAEFVSLQNQVEALSTENREIFDRSIALWSRDRDFGYALAVDALQNGRSFAEFSSTLEAVTVARAHRNLDRDLGGGSGPQMA